MILFLHCPRVPGLNHVKVVSPNQTQASADIIDQWADHASNRRRKSGLAWAERPVEQKNRKEDHPEMLVLAGFDPSGVDQSKLLLILESLLASISPTDLPPCRQRAGSSLMEADFMSGLERELRCKAAAGGILLKDLPLRRSHHIMKISCIAIALFALAAGFLFDWLKPKAHGGKPPPLPGKEASPDGSRQQLSPWAFLARAEWRAFTDNVGLKLTDEEVAQLRPTSGTPGDAVTSDLQAKLLRWAHQMKEEMNLPSEQPQEIESSRTLGVVRDARAPGDKALPAGWITNFKDQRNRYDNEQRSAAVELADFLHDIEKENKPDELRPIIDRACTALVEFKGAAAFSDLIKSKAQELQPCPKGWSVPTLRDVQRLSVVRQVLSSPAFVKIVYDDNEVSRPVSSWEEIYKLCEAGRKLHETGSAERKLFDGLFK